MNFKYLRYRVIEVKKISIKHVFLIELPIFLCFTFKVKDKFA